MLNPFTLLAFALPAAIAVAAAATTSNRALRGLFRNQDEKTSQTASSPPYLLLAAAAGLSPAPARAQTLLAAAAQQPPIASIGTAGSELGDIAIGLISGRPSYWSDLHASVLRHAPRGMILQAPGKCNCGFVAGFHALRAAQPGAKWYYVGDEDAFLYLDRLTKLVSRYNPNLPTAIAMLGTHPVYERICGTSSPIQETITELGSLTFFGGTGIILSSALVNQVDWNRPCERASRVGADRDVTCLIGSSWKPSYRYVSLKALKRPANQQNVSEHDSEEVVTVHHLAPSDFKAKAVWNAHLGGQEPLRLMPLASNHGCK